MEIAYDLAAAGAITSITVRSEVSTSERRQRQRGHKWRERSHR
jgi:hypothetical protein